MRNTRIYTLTAFALSIFLVLSINVDRTLSYVCQDLPLQGATESSTFHVQAVQDFLQLSNVEYCINGTEWRVNQQNGNRKSSRKDGAQGMGGC